MEQSTVNLEESQISHRVCRNKERARTGKAVNVSIKVDLRQPGLMWFVHGESSQSFTVMFWVLFVSQCFYFIKKFSSSGM